MQKKAKNPVKGEVMGVLKQQGLEDELKVTSSLGEYESQIAGKDKRR